MRVSSRRRTAAIRSSVLALGALLLGAVLASAQTGRFYTITPCRVIDTRRPVGPYGGPALSGNTSRDVTVAGTCGVPTNAGSVAVNVTVTGATAGGNFRVYPSGSPLPGSSSINYAAQQTRANNGTFGLGTGGALSVYCNQNSGTAHLILDVFGWFDDDSPPPPPPPGGGSQIWARRMSGPTAFDNAYVNSVAVDGQGNAVVAGYFERSVDFGGGTLTSAGASDVFVAKFSSTGGHVWSRRFGGVNDDIAEGVSFDGAGDVVVAGYFSGSADFGSGVLTSAGGTDVFVAKYSSNGAPSWSRRFGSTGTDRGLAVDVDGSGNYVFAGYMVGTVDFGGGALTSAGAADVFLVKYSPAGGHIWSKRFGGSSSDVALAVAVDAGGDMALTGYFQGTSNFGGQNLTSAGANDAFLVRYDMNGREVWSKRFGNSSDDRGTSVAIDGQGAVIATGSFLGTVDFGGGAIANAGGSDIYLAKYSSSGTYSWARTFGTSASVGETANAVAVDGGGNVLLTGAIVNTVDFGGGGLATNGTYDVFIAKFRSDGVHTWSKRYGALYDDHGWGITSDAAGNVIAAGDFIQSINFGGGALVNDGGADSWIAKLTP